MGFVRSVLHGFPADPHVTAEANECVAGAEKNTCGSYAEQ